MEAVANGQTIQLAKRDGWKTWINGVKNWQWKSPKTKILQN